MRRAAFAAALCFAAGSAAAQPWTAKRCAKIPIKGFKAWSAHMLDKGAEAVLEEAYYQLVDPPAPAKRFTYDGAEAGDGLDRQANLIVTLDEQAKIVPAAVILVTMLQMPEYRERWFFKLDAKGALEKVMIIRDKTDGKGELVAAPPDIKFRGKYDPETIKRYSTEKRFHCWQKPS